MKKKIFFVFMVGAVLLAIFFVAKYLTVRINSEKKDDAGEQILDSSITEVDINICIKDSDCIVVPYSHCCGSTKRTINKKYKKLYESTPEWQVFYGAVCNVIGLCASDAHINTALCRSHMCVLKY